MVSIVVLWTLLSHLQMALSENNFGKLWHISMSCSDCNKTRICGSHRVNRAASYVTTSSARQNAKPGSLAKAAWVSTVNSACASLSTSYLYACILYCFTKFTTTAWIY
jgi:hypothetical protein